MPNDSDELPENARHNLTICFLRPAHGSARGRVVDVVSGNAKVQATIEVAHTNFGGGHGGIMFSLGDIAMSFAPTGTDVNR